MSVIYVCSHSSLMCLHSYFHWFAEQGILVINGLLLTDDQCYLRWFVTLA